MIYWYTQQNTIHSTTLNTFSVLFLCSNDGSIRVKVNMVHSHSIYVSPCTCMCDALPQAFVLPFCTNKPLRKKEEGSHL